MIFTRMLHAKCMYKVNNIICHEISLTHKIGLCVQAITGEYLDQVLQLGFIEINAEKKTNENLEYFTCSNNIIKFAT